jgi:hypothetical protein
LRASVDEAALWSTFTAGPGGDLRGVALRCVEAGGQTAVKGEVAWSAFALERAVEEARRPPGDARQDELWLAEGDQLFGRVTAADGRGVQIDGRFGRRRFGWEELRGWYPRREKPPAAKVVGTVVRVRLRSGLAADADDLVGVITGLDANKLTLKHAWLGELGIDRRWVREVRRVDRP